MSRAGLMRLRAMTTRFARAVTDKLCVALVGHTCCR